MKTSLLTSIYGKNTVGELNRCFESIQSQSHVPSEIILVIDGPISTSVVRGINEWKKKLPLIVSEIKENRGLAFALNYGMTLCANDWVFRMDIDDVCAEKRFVKQLEIISSDKSIDILGGQILCFERFPKLFQGRVVPTTNEAIQRMIKYRNPVNHPSVLFNRKKILKIGGYPDARLGQDYLLWINAIVQGLKIRNMEDVLVYMQVDKDSYSRRGLRNLKYDIYPYFSMYKKRVSNIVELTVGVLMRVVYCVYCSTRSAFKP